MWNYDNVAERSEAWTVFARSDARIVGSNPTEAWMFVYVYSVFVLGSGLAIGWSLIQGVLPTRLRNWSETMFHGCPMLQQKWKQQEYNTIQYDNVNDNDI
jgi:hypothetical protein